MNTENMINSIYNPKRKSKEMVILPKIFKGQATPPQSRAFPRGATRKYNQQNIFKIEDEKRQKVKLHIEEERLRELRGKECEELEARIADMLRKHQEELKQIDQSEKQIAEQIDGTKQTHYQIKLNIWELKNQIMDLNGMLQEEEAELKRLEALMPLDEGEYAQIDDPDEQEGLLVDGQLAEEEQYDLQEGDEENQSMNILHSLSQEANLESEQI